MNGLLRENAGGFKPFITVRTGEQKASDAGDGPGLQERRIAAVEELKDQA